jgi:kynureninase
MDQRELLARAAHLDAGDALAPLREAFHMPEGMVYLDGNSLGLMPKAVPARLQAVAHQEWSEGLIRSWSNAGWFDLPMAVGDRIAPVIGAGPGEVAVGDSTSVNLFKCLAAALHLRPGRTVILAEANNFPTDIYMAQGLAALVPGVRIEFLEEGQTVAQRVHDQVAVVLLSHVDYRTAVVRDMERINREARAGGALVLWDLSHTAGAVHCDLRGSGSDLAVGCTYKYLNGGPGAPAYCWIRAELMEQVRQPLAGWMGHAAPFGFPRDYAPAPGARRMVCGTPQVLSLSALDEALKIWGGVDLAALFAKSRVMTDFFIEAVEALCAGHGLQLRVPRDAAARGSHVSFDLPQGFEVMQALAARGVIGDFRAPATMRFGFAPMYLRFADVARAAVLLRDIVDTREWDQPRFRVRGKVT